MMGCMHCSMPPCAFKHFTVDRTIRSYLYNYMFWSCQYSPLRYMYSIPRLAFRPNRHEHAFQLFHVCEVAKIILYKVTSRKVNSAAISTSCTPYNSVQECCYKSAHMKNLDNFPRHAQSVKLTWHTTM